MNNTLAAALIDIGSNLSNPKFQNDLREVTRRAKASGVVCQILTTTSELSWARNTEMCAADPGYFYTTYGLHPHSAKDLSGFLANCQFTGTNEAVRAIGEVGLDYDRMLSSKKLQWDCLEHFIEVAEATGLPLFLHERAAHSDFVSLLRNVSPSIKKVVHCFTGTPEQAQEYLAMGCHLGVTGWITDDRRNSEVVSALEIIPLDRLMVETDCPYLAPRNMPAKISRCEPCHLSYVAKKLAEIKEIPYEMCAVTVRETTEEFFGLAPK